ncbi:MAG: substrate-binding periplasmic protein [Phycisphaerae bacterium]
MVNRSLNTLRWLTAHSIRSNASPIILLLGALITAAGCAQPPVITIATDAAFPPFHFLNDDESVTGHDIELAKTVLDHAGYQHRVRVVRPYSQLLDGLENGEHDMVAATTGITIERRKRFLFSLPYFKTCQAFLVRKGTNEPQSRAALAGLRVGATGTGTSASARDKVTNVVHVALPSGTDGVDALLAREVDAFVVDEFEAVAAARTHPEKLAVLPEPAALELYGFVMATDRIELLQAVNDALVQLEQDGVLTEIRKTFGVARDADWPIVMEE